MADKVVAEVIPETVQDALVLWDRDQPVWSVEMGGIGPGYEQVIQLMAFEMMRFYKEVDWPATEGWSEDRWKVLQAKRDEVLKPFYSKHQPTGAQVGAAGNLASMVCRKGYRAALMDPEVTDRHIYVTKNFPGDP